MSSFVKMLMVIMPLLLLQQLPIIIVIIIIIIVTSFFNILCFSVQTISEIENDFQIQINYILHAMS